jgi:hypothetical protein
VDVSDARAISVASIGEKEVAWSHNIVLQGLAFLYRSKGERFEPLAQETVLSMKAIVYLGTARHGNEATVDYLDAVG